MKRNRNIDGFMQKSAMLLMGLLLLASCGSKRSSVAESSVTPLPTDAKAVDEALLVRVNSNSVNEQNIVGSMKFSLNMNGRNISAPGSLHMRRNEIIRLQVFVPLLGSEVGRVDFTPTKVLLVDRLHKEYIEADYTTISFLKNNNIDFYTFSRCSGINFLFLAPTRLPTLICNASHSTATRRQADSILPLRVASLTTNGRQTDCHALYSKRFSPMRVPREASRK